MSTEPPPPSAPAFDLPPTAPQAQLGNCPLCGGKLPDFEGRMGTVHLCTTPAFLAFANEPLWDPAAPAPPPRAKPKRPGGDQPGMPGPPREPPLPAKPPLAPSAERPKRS